MNTCFFSISFLCHSQQFDANHGNLLHGTSWVNFFFVKVDSCFFFSLAVTYNTAKARKKQVKHISVKSWQQIATVFLPVMPLSLLTLLTGLITRHNFLLLLVLLVFNLFLFLSKKLFFFWDFFFFFLRNFPHKKGQNMEIMKVICLWFRRNLAGVT